MKKLTLLLLLITLLAASTKAQCTFTVNLGNDTTICQGGSLILDAANGDSTSVIYLWNTGDTTQILSALTGGIYWVDVSINGCIERDSITLNIINPPQISFDSSSAVCEGIVTNYYSTINDTTGVNYQWDFGDGSAVLDTNSLNISYLYNSSGSYSAVLAASRNGCTAVYDTSTVFVLQKPIVAINIPPVCNGTQTIINNNSIDSSGAMYEWNFGDGSTTLDTSSISILDYSYATSDSFYVKATITNLNGCIAIDSTIAYVAPAPNAGLTIINDTICENEPLLVLNTSTNTVGSLISLFTGDGGVIIQNTDTIEYYYNSFGDFQVTINLDNGICSEDFAFDSVHIKITPNLNLSSNTVCSGETSVLSLQLSDTLNPLVIWNYGDNTGNDTIVSIQQNYLYNGNGQNHNAIVKIINDNHCSMSDTNTVFIDLKPTFNFTANEACFGENTLFTNNSIDTFQTSYNMFYGDNNSLNSFISSYLYDTSGIFNLIITGKNNNTCPTDTFFATVNVKSIPIANFALSTNNICSGDSVLLINNSLALPTAKYTWNLDNGIIFDSVTNQFSYTYMENGGDFHINLIVDNENGCLEDTTENILIINPVPVLNFAIDTICFGDSTMIINLSTGILDTTIYTVNFGDGNSQTFIDFDTIRYFYADDGVYPISILVNNQNGCFIPIYNHNTLVRAVPVANFSGTMVCYGDSTTLVDNSYDIIDTSATYSWIFGDGETSDTVANSFNHLFDNENGNVYQTILTINNNNSCVASTDTQIIMVHSVPVLNFAIDTICFGDSTTIINLSTGILDTTIYTVNFGDGNSQVFIGSDTIKYSYVDDGIYPISILVDNQNGCATPIYLDSIKVKAVPIVSFITDTICYGDSTRFTNNSVFIPSATLSWNFGDLTMSNTQQSIFNHFYGGFNGVNYEAVLQIDNNNGCAISIDTFYAVIDKRPTAIMTVDTAICEPNATQFNNTSTGVDMTTTLLLNYGDGTPIDTIGYNQNASHNYSNAQVYYVSLVVNNNNTCPIDTFLDTTELKLTPIIDLGVSTVCYDNPTVFTNASSHVVPNALYYLNYGDGLTDTLNYFFTHSYTYGYNGNDYNAIVTIDNRRGCTSTDTLIASVLKRPYLNYTVDTVCQKIPTTILNMTNDTTVTSNALYYVSYGDGNADTLTHHPVYNYTFDTCNYMLPYYNITMTLDNGNSCVDVINYKPAYVHCLPDVSFTGLRTEYCFNDPFEGDILKGMPQGGFFYPSILFDPSLDTLNQTWAAYHPLDTGNNILVRYKYTDNNNCTVIDSQYIDVVRTLPTFSINGLPTHLCLEDSAIVISATVAGGIFNSNLQNIFIIEDASYDSIAIFRPIDTTSIGRVFYNYADTFGCANVQVKNFVVYPLPDVYLGNDTIVPFNGFPITLGAGTGNNYTYTWSNGLSTPTTQAFNPGYYILTIHDAFPQITCVDSDTILVDIGSSTGQYKNDIGLKVYPNPVKDILNLNIDLPITEKLQMQVFDMRGLQLLQKQVYIYENVPQNIQFDMTDYPSGQYIMNIKTSNNLIWQVQIQKM